MEDRDEIILEYKKSVKEVKIKFFLILIISIIITAVAASEFSLYYYASQMNNIEKLEASQNKKENIDRIANTLNNFRKVIDSQYIGEIDEQKVMDETIKGYINGLDDEYSEYMTSSEWEDYQADALGNYVGIGIYMSVDKNDNIVVVEPIKDTPAEKAGLKTGDIIVFVDEENVLGGSSEEVSSRIKGEEGTKVKITILRGDEYLDFEIERKAIKVYHVEEKMLENNIGYMSLITFDEGCADELQKSYNLLKSQGAKKIILDLRNNTGGLVDEALQIADMILPKGNKKINESKNNPIITEEIVVLVNEYSASASEILVGAIKDNNRGKIVGKNTYGKGVIQSVFMLEDGSALKLTVNEYFTPNETKINKIGIAPDYDIDLDYEAQEDTQLNKALELLK